VVSRNSKLGKNHRVFFYDAPQKVAAASVPKHDFPIFDVVLSSSFHPTRPPSPPFAPLHTEDEASAPLFGARPSDPPTDSLELKVGNNFVLIFESHSKIQFFFAELQN